MLSSDVFVIRLSNPPLNILNKQTRIQLLNDLEQAVSGDAKVIVLVGSESSFSVGADITEMNLRIGKELSAKNAVSQQYVDAYKESNLASVVYALDSCPKPIVALITGQCFGGGLELALGCHYRICTHDAKFRFPETLLGILPGALGTQLLPRLVAFDICIKMCTGNCTILNAKNANEVGLVDQVLSMEEESAMPEGSNQRLENYIARTIRVLRKHIERVNAVIVEGKQNTFGSIVTSGINSEINVVPHPFRRTSMQKIVTSNLSDSSRAAYLAMHTLPSIERGGRANQETIRSLLACVQFENNFFAGARMESEISRYLVASDEAQALRWAFFAERAVTSSKHQNKSSYNSTSQSSGHSITSKTIVGVVGAGTMGSGIAAAIVMNGIHVILCDASAKALAIGKARIDIIIKNAIKKGRISSKNNIGTLTTTPDLHGLSTADIVIEAVYENIELKKKIFKELDNICPKHSIFCSNTSSLDVDILAQETRRPDKVLGLHFFSPAHIMKLVEIVICNNTSTITIEIVKSLVKNIKKIGVLVSNLPGFVGNRMIFVYAMEAMLLLEDGATVLQIDNVMKSFGMAMGPFEMADLSGLDVGFNIRLSKGLVDNNGKAAQSSSIESKSVPSYSSIADVLYKSGRLGAKNGKGFYKYVVQNNRSGSKRPVATVDPDVTEIIIKETQRKIILKAASISKPKSGMYQLSPVISNNITVTDDEIKKRLLFCLINEGFKLLGENGCTSDRPGDIDVIYMHGYGFPSYKGGPMFYIDYDIGIRQFLNELNDLYKIMPNSNWFEPAPLLYKMLRNNITLWQLQQNPNLVSELMKQKDVNRKISHSRL